MFTRIESGTKTAETIKSHHNVGGLPEIVPNGKVGYSVEPEAKVIADAINDFYSNGRYAEFVENIKEEKKKYSWDRMLENVGKAMEQVK